jgi:phospholipid/cholesterol/gamma-HCH transport system substrate-binding protein
VDGLATGSDVRLSGIKVGTVVSQAIDPKNYKAVVTMNLANDVKIPDDSSAKITSEGLLGSNYVALTPGGSEDFLKNGSQIDFTQGSVDLMGLIGQAVFSATGDKSGSNK